MRGEIEKDYSCGRIALYVRDEIDMFVRAYREVENKGIAYLHF